MSGIGLLNEGSLHASLKQWYARAGDRYEVPVEGYVVDIVRDDLLLEVQTRHIGAIRSKLASLAETHRLRLIHPIAREKWIVRLDPEGDGVLSRRRSPKRGRLEDVFHELVGFPALMTHPNLSLEVVLIQEEETRRFDGKRAWRRRGWVVEERRLLEIVDQRRFDDASDWLDLLPRDLDRFTTADLAETMQVPRDLAQKVAYCLRKAGFITMIGQEGRSKLYGIGGGSNHE